MDTDLQAQECVNSAGRLFRSGVVPTISQLRNTMAVGKSVGIWGHSYSIMELRYFRAVAAAASP